MARKSQISADDGFAALRAVVAGGYRRADLATAVRFTLQELARRVPGGAVEVRVPPYAAVQCIPGAKHTRGTPPAVIEVSPEVWLELALGDLTWPAAVASGSLQASGERATLAPYLPIFERTQFSAAPTTREDPDQAGSDEHGR